MDADRQFGHDPIMDTFSGVYAPVAAGPQGSVLLAPRDAGTSLSPASP